MTQLENPVQIDRIERDATKGGDPVISLFSNPLEFPVLQLFPHEYGLLIDVDIDPNSLIPGQPMYTRFLAAWDGSVDKYGRPRLNKDGNQYKNVVALRRSPGGGRTLDDIYDLLAQIVAIMGGDPTAAEHIHADEMLAKMGVQIEEPRRAVVPQPKPKPAQTAVPQQAQQPQPKPAQTAVNGNGGNGRSSSVEKTTPAEWLQRSGAATDPFDFDTCISRAIPYYGSIDRVESARVNLFGEWVPGLANAYLVGLQKYAVVRDELETSQPTTIAHRDAKAVALVVYRQALDAQRA